MGFDDDLIVFLSELKFSNTISNQEKNIVKYRRLISEPLEEMYSEMLPTIYAIDECFETRRARCISTPYTDRRFSRNVPLKEYMYIRFKEMDKSDNVPGLYFDMGLEYYGCGIRIYKQTSSGMEKLRERILKNIDEYSEQLSLAYSRGFELTGEKYKQDHYPDIPESPAKELLNHRSFYIEKARPVGDEVFQDDFSGKICGEFNNLSALIKLLL